MPSKVYFFRTITAEKVLELVYASNDPGKAHLIQRIESRNGILTVEAAAELGFGSREYELIEVE